jgi:osmoprotectant transport system ATP-binding protein
MITLDGVTKRFPDGTVAVDDLTLEIPTGTVMALLGSSGSGKTTTLRMINRLVEPTSGTISVDGRDIRSVDVQDLRRSMGYVIQQAGLFPHRTIIDNVMTVPRLLGWDRARARARAREMLELVGLDPAIGGRYPAQLSGGQQQRVGVARALASDPPVLLMDEPLGAVDPIVRTQLQEEFARLQRELAKTVVFVTHDVDEAITVSTMIAVLRPGGSLAQLGTPHDVLASPVDEFVDGFMGKDRAVKLLGLHPAGHVPCRPLDAPVDGFDLDAAALVWRRGTERLPASVVRPGETARHVLDRALAHPLRAVVQLDEAGRPFGWSALDDLRRVGGGPLA